MGSDRSKLLVLLVVYAGLVGAALFGMDWFVIKSTFGNISLDLRSVHSCPSADQCVTISLSMVRGIGFYPMLAGFTFWGMLGLSAVVCYQAATRLLSDSASESITKLGYGGAVVLLGATVGAAYLFGPDVGSVTTSTVSLSSERTFAPLMMIGGQLAAFGVLFFTAEADGLRSTVPAARAMPARELAPPPAAEPVARAARATVPPPPVPDELRDKLRFATSSAELTRAGIDARREDGSSVLVMWRDIVGAVARRLPPAQTGATFVDVISTAGSTLRILPWTRLNGDPVEGEGEARARALIGIITARRPEAQLDAATRRFIETSTPAAQLPDLAMLDAHDTRLG